ncbi:unnamed protein product [Prorocentrum cordatum]|uniref:PAS domain-containing protein n=1 Tax=Prorocentrum cordatum TaxID=2364126 RepID=A0ABN9W0W3_9DINO|nr:unnamed protein product [Polarella glacialis]
MSVLNLYGIVHHVERICAVACAAMMLGRLIRQLWTEGVPRSWFRDCYGRWLAWSAVFRAVVFGRAGIKRKQFIRLAMARRSYQFFLVGAFALIFPIVLSPEPLFFPSEDVRPHMLPRRLHYAFSWVVIVSVNVFPSLLTPSRLHVWYSLLSLSHAMTLSPLLQFSGAIGPLKFQIFYDCLMYCMVDLSLPANVLWTTICYASASYTVIAGESKPPKTPGGKPIGMKYPDPKIIHDVVHDWILAVILLVVIHVVFSIVVNSLLEGQACRSELRAARSTLAGVCDAVVELDSNLMLAGPSEKLAALLMHSQPRSLVGLSVSSFLATEADREKFAKEVTSNTAHDDFCTAFHVKLRDNFGIYVSVEVFSVRFSSSDEKESYLVGFREFADLAPSRRTQPSVPTMPSADMTMDVQSRLQSYETERKDGGTNSEGESCASSSIPEVAVWVDAMSQDLTMLRCTMAFEMLVGSSWAQICATECHLLQCTRPDQRDDLKFWVRHACDKSTAHVLPTVSGVCFRFGEHHHRSRFAIKNRVRVSVAPPGGEDWPEGLDRPPCVAKLVLERPRWIQDQRWTRRASAPVRPRAPLSAGALGSDGAGAAAAAAPEDAGSAPTPPQRIGQAAQPVAASGPRPEAPAGAGASPAEAGSARSSDSEGSRGWLSL